MKDMDWIWVWLIVVCYTDALDCTGQKARVRELERRVELLERAR